MKITVKLFSSLMSYLPDDTDDNEIVLQLNSAMSAQQILSELKIPPEEVNTMMLNGVFLPPEQRDDALNDNDTLTVWPLIQGG